MTEEIPGKAVNSNDRKKLLGGLCKTYYKINNYTSVSGGVGITMKRIAFGYSTVKQATNDLWTNGTLKTIHPTFV